VEELDFKGMLDMFQQKGFTRAEQFLLANFGTNQTALSICFQEPNRLQLVDQKEEDGELVRTVNLYCGDDLVCIAVSHIPIERNLPEVISDVASGSLGLGQIVVTHNLPNHRTLLEVGRDKASFWRTYAIEGRDVYMKIHEHFPRKPFLKVGWEVGDGD
jgi:chorismate-pyruvate lyase